MKAFLLAAGEGRRLRPLTDRVPKCLVPINGQPLLSIWFEALVTHGVTSVLLNTHHLEHEVEQFVHDHAPSALDIQLAHESILLGSAGTIRANRDFIETSDPFFIVYADNLTDIDLTSLYRFHLSHSNSFTMALFRTPAPKTCGIADLDAEGAVIAFEEKPQSPSSGWANAGIYIADQDILERIPDKTPCDLGYDVLPRMIGEMHGFRWNGFHRDIGTLERLNEACQAWKQHNEKE